MQTLYTYNDGDFDRKHHPITESHKQAIEGLRKQFNCSAAVHYSSTVHGAIFSMSTSESRADKADIEFLNTVQGFRWFELTANRLVIGLEHKSN